jgi:hypothetical protein
MWCWCLRQIELGRNNINSELYDRHLGISKESDKVVGIAHRIYLVYKTELDLKYNIDRTRNVKQVASPTLSGQK